MFAERPKNNIVDVSNDVSFYALISLSIIFTIVVTYGWATMLTPLIAIPGELLEDHHEYSEILTGAATLLRYAAGVAIALAGIVLGKAVAAERIRISAESKPNFNNTWKAYFVVLLIISALGTMNTMFMQSQQSGVLGDAISNTRNRLQQLRFKIDESLTTPDYDRTREDVENRFRAFEIELRNPANCGFGAQALVRFRDLQLLLPKLKALAVGSSACQNIGVIIEAYKGTVDKLADELPDPATKRRFRQRNAFTSLIEKTIANIEGLKVQNASLSKSTALPSLAAAWNTYSQILKEAELIAGKSFGLPAEIVDKNIQGMGNITQIIPLLISQFDNPLTYVTIVAAILFDVLLITFFTRHLHGLVTATEGHANSPITGWAKQGSSGKNTNLLEKTERFDRGLP